MATTLKRNFDDAFLGVGHVIVRRAEAAGVHSSGKSPRAAAACKGGRKCTECGATETPQWRQGPEGPQTLCNACGVRHSRQMRKMRGAKCAKLSVAATPSPSPSWDADSDTNSEDVSRGTVVDVSIHTPIRAAAASPARAGPVARGARRAPARPARGASLPSSPMRPAVVCRDNTNAMSVDDEHEDSEAALNLLSIAAAAATSVCVSTGTAPRPAREPVTIAPVPATRTGSIQSAAALEGLDVMRLMHAPGLQALVPQLGASQMHELRALCHAFDASYQELVAAHAACDAVGRVLAAKRAEAGAARAATIAVLERLVTQATAVAADAPLKALRAALSPCGSVVSAGPAAAAAAATSSLGVAEDAASVQGEGCGAASQQVSQQGLSEGGRSEQGSAGPASSCEHSGPEAPAPASTEVASPRAPAPAEPAPSDAAAAPVAAVSAHMQQSQQTQAGASEDEEDEDKDEMMAVHGATISLEAAA